MKNVLKAFWTQIRWVCAIALVAIIGFYFAACGGSDDDDKNDNNNNNNNNNGTVTAASLYGTWWFVGEPWGGGIYDSLVFGKNDGKDQFVWDGYKVTDDLVIYSGNYTVSGSTLSLVSVGISGSSSGNVTISANGNTITLSGFTNWSRLNGTWYKQGAGLSSGAVTLNSVTANGSSTQTTSEIVLTFNEKINGLSASDITLTGVAGVTKGTLSGGPRYVLPISGFTAGGTLNVAVAKTGFTISGSPKTVTIYALNWNSAVDVYVVGYSKDGSTRKATIWKNGVKTILNNSESGANSVYVSGSNVYVAGYVGLVATTASRATLWRNGTAQTLSSTAATANSVFVSGSDVYVAGYTLNSTPYRAVYWKNGTQTTLTTPSVSSYSNFAYANSIFVSGSNVYVAGRAGNTLDEKATYWKNNETPQVFSTSSTEAFSLFVSGSVVYMVGGGKGGLTSGTAWLWKSDTGTVTNLSSNASAKSVFVSGSDVYVAGNNSSSVVLWKNGVSQTLGSAGTGDSVYVYGSDVYVAGYTTSGGATLWINGQERYLDDTGSAHAVFVTARQ